MSRDTQRPQFQVKLKRSFAIYIYFLKEQVDMFLITKYVGKIQRELKRSHISKFVQDKFRQTKSPSYKWAPKASNEENEINILATVLQSSRSRQIACECASRRSVLHVLFVVINIIHSTSVANKNWVVQVSQIGSNFIDELSVRFETVIYCIIEALPHCIDINDYYMKYLLWT